MGDATPRGNRTTFRAYDTRKALVLRKAFDVYDTDGSGAIDYEELRRLLRDLGWPYDDAFVQRAVTVLDTDNSGEIGFSEFLKWTEFAYSARILYRDEFCSSPVGASRPKVDACEVQGAQSSPWIRRVLQENNQQLERAMPGAHNILSTVFEEPECQNEHESLHPNESQACGENKETLPSNFVLLSPRHRSGRVTENNLRQRRLSNGTERILEGTDEVEFSAPITKMAKMALGPKADSERGTTSRIRSKSAESFHRSDNVIRGRERYRGDGKNSGPRVRSKATARMLWACKQLGSKSMAYDSEEEELDTPNERKNKQTAANMGRQRIKVDDKQEKEEALRSMSQGNRSRSRRFSCIENPSWFVKISNQSEFVEESKVDRDKYMKKTSSI